MAATSDAQDGLTRISDYQALSWPADRARWACDQLERGRILFFPVVPFDFPQTDREFLLSQKQTGSRFHKNISYRPSRDLLKGADSEPEDRERLQSIMRHFSSEVTGFIKSLLAPYAGKINLDYASFRPLEERGRDLPVHKRNDLLHVDAFPTRPTRGARILRVFANINPEESRVWNIGQPFHIFAPELAKSEKLDPPYRGALARTLAHLAGSVGLPVADRSRYDEFMLYFHDWSLCPPRSWSRRKSRPCVCWRKSPAWRWRNNSRRSLTTKDTKGHKGESRTHWLLSTSCSFVSFVVKEISYWFTGILMIFFWIA